MKKINQVIVFLMYLILPTSPLRADTVKLFDQAEILNQETLDIKVLQDWHVDTVDKASRQKLIEIKVADWWPGQEYRIPVRFIVPLDRKAKGFHITSQHLFRSLSEDTALNKIQKSLIEGGVGLVYTVVQRLAAIPGGRKLENERLQKFLNIRNPRYSDLWIWAMTLMRAATAAYADTDHFEPGKVAGTGSSKNGWAPAIALIHDTRFTATFSSVAPAYVSPLRYLDQATVDSVNLANDKFFKDIQEGKINSFDHPVDWYRERAWGVSEKKMPKLALKAGIAWEELRQYVRDNAGQYLVSENWDQLMARNADIFFQPGTHDWVAFDILWGAQNHPQIPVYYKPNGGHGQKPHSASAVKVENLAAFLLNHFFGGESLLLTPKSSHTVAAGQLQVTVTFSQGPQPESGRIWWMYDRAPAGSAAFLCRRIPDDQWKDMSLDPKTSAWTAVIPLNSDASSIDFFSNHYLKAYGHLYSRSSPYTRVNLK